MIINSKDPGKGHFYVSLVKSALRIGAAIALYYAFSDNLLAQGAAVLFMTAEVLGIIEEII